MIKKITKKITFQLRLPVNGVSKNNEFAVIIDDNATFVEALAAVDKFIFEHPDTEKSHFTKNHVFVRCYLQLFWDPEKNEIYSDINVFAAGARGFMPIRDNIKFNLYNDSEISLTSSA